MAAGNQLQTDELQIVKLTEDLDDQATALFTDHFLKYENVSIAMDLLGAEQTVSELKKMLDFILADRVSFAMVHKDSKILVGFCVNKILNPSKDMTMRNFEEFSSSKMEALSVLLDRMENTVDIYKEWNIDCAFELMFLSTHSEYGGRGIARRLVKHSIEFARAMLHGDLDEAELLALPGHVRDMKPKAVTSIFTSLFSQKAGLSFGMEPITTIPYTEFHYEGKSFSELLDPIHKNNVYAAMRL